jgi:hypothetical protein
VEGRNNTNEFRRILTVEDEPDIRGIAEIAFETVEEG